MTTFLFDLDGTLSDSRGGLYLSFRAALAEIGAPALAEAELARFLGTPLPAMFRALDPGIDDAGIERGMAAFRAAFEAEGIFVNTLYPGVIDMLGRLGQGGHDAWVVTSKPEKYARQVVAHLALEDRFAGVVGAGLDETDTKETLIARALAEAGAAAADTAMLGDRHYDVTGALANRVLPVGALWGYGARVELEEAGCRHFADDLAGFSRLFVDDVAREEV
jgi:phosphoglycolate phosphatase